jgi:hypothetical protein
MNSKRQKLARPACWKSETRTATTPSVRRQTFWDSGRLKIRESLARLVCDVMRPADGAASGDLRLSVV